MAKRTEVIVLDDISGEAGAEVHRFELDGSAYEIDLSDKNYAELAEVLAPFVSAARRLGRTKGSGGPRFPRSAVRHGTTTTSTQSNGHVTTAEDRAAIRAWWRLNAGRLSLPAPTERGRIPESIVTAYRDGSQKAAAVPAQPDVPGSAAEAPTATRPGRKAIPSPPNSELMETYRRLGTVKAVAANYNVSQGTANRWINNAQLANIA